LISKRNIIKKAQSAIKYTGSIQERPDWEVLHADLHQF